MEYDNTNRFALFPVKEKKNPKGPDFDGPGDCKGRKIRVACWRKTSKSGQPFLSCQIEFDDERQQRQNQAGSQSAPPPSDDNIPF